VQAIRGEILVFSRETQEELDRFPVTPIKRWNSATAPCPPARRRIASIIFITISIGEEREEAAWDQGIPKPCKTSLLFTSY
jgi:hypothetical protein